MSSYCDELQTESWRADVSPEVLNMCAPPWAITRPEVAKLWPPAPPLESASELIFRSKRSDDSLGRVP